MLKRILIAGIAAGALAASAGAPALADIDVEALETGLWRVSAEGETLDLVITRLAEESDLELRGGDRLASGPGLDGEIEGTLNEVVLRLLRGRDYALVYGETPETQDQIQRVVILSDRVGDIAPDGAARPAAERLEPVRPVTQEDAERVSAMLRRQVQPLLDAEAQANGEAPAVTSAAAGSASQGPSGDGAGGDGGDADLDAATQAQLAEATRRAQADLQALVNALQAQDRAAGNGN